MKQLSDFKEGDVVVWSTKQYDVDTRSYYPIKRMAVVTLVGENGVIVETDRGKNPDYNMHIGSSCLDQLEILPPGITPLRKRA